MLKLYYTPNTCALASHIALEQAGADYEAVRVDFASNEQRKPEFLKLNPAGLIPVIVDQDGPGGKPLTLAQSGAIILYAAEKAGRFMPKDAHRRAMALQWFTQGLSDIAGTSGALFRVENSVPDKIPGNTEYFRKRLLDFFSVCDAHLADREFLADEFSIAELMLYPNYALRKSLLDQAGGFAALHRWGTAVGSRPGIQKGMQVLG